MRQAKNLQASKENKIVHVVRSSVSRAVYISPWSSIVEVAAPVSVGPSLDAVAPGVVGEELQVARRDEVVVPVHHLQVAEVGGTVEALTGEAPAAHLRRRVRPGRPGVDDLAAELHHVGVPRQVGEQVRRPVADDQARAHLQPPVTVLRILSGNSSTRNHAY
jgi:hypothetical protein